MCVILGYSNNNETRLDYCDLMCQRPQRRTGLRQIEVLDSRHPMRMILDVMMRINMSTTYNVSSMYFTYFFFFLRQILFFN